MKNVNDLLEEVYKPMVVEFFLAGNPFLPRGDGWPRKFELFPQIAKVERIWNFRKFYHREVVEWFNDRPMFLGGRGSDRD